VADELTGGFIRNAVLAALMRAVGRSPEAPRIVQADLHEGCREQMRGALQLHGSADGSLPARPPPARPLDGLVLAPSLSQSLHGILSMEKARPVLAAEWGFGEAFARRGGVTALFWGPPGAGKRSAAESLAFELGRPTRVVHFAALVGGGGGGGGGYSGRGGGKGATGYADTLTSVFRDGRLADALILVSGVDPRIESLARDERGLQLLLHELERYPGVVVLCCCAAEPLDSIVHTVHPALLRAMKAVVEFKLPDGKVRERLWRALVPPSCPVDAAFDAAALATESDGFGAARIEQCIVRAAALAAMASGASRGAEAQQAAPGTAGVGGDGDVHAPTLRQADLLNAVREERGKEEGRQSRLVLSMMS
jgi:hypothetical protein